MRTPGGTLSKKMNNLIPNINSTYLALGKANLQILSLNLRIQVDECSKTFEA